MLSPLPFTIIKHNELNIFSIAIQYITLSKGKLVISKAIYKVIIYKAHNSEVVNQWYSKSYELLHQQ